MLKVALTHDIDRVDKSYQYITQSLAHIRRLNGIGLKNQFRSLFVRNPYWTFDQLIEIEKSFEIRSTIFFLNESISLTLFSLDSYKLSMGRYNIHDPRIVKVINVLDKNGWEIGVHGSYNSYKSKRLLLSEKLVLEEIVGHQIEGVRQHYLNLNHDTWRIQSEIGFRYDSSWGFTNDIGFKENKIKPFFPLDNKFKIIPLTLMDTCFMGKSNRWVEYETLLDLCEENDAVMVINFHQHVLSNFDFPGYKDAYIELITRALKRNAKFFTLAEINEMN